MLMTNHKEAAHPSTHEDHVAMSSLTEIKHLMWHCLTNDK